jgi:Arf-GAP/SH3 domain/ANK repeat/PH domain-containing protein
MCDTCVADHAALEADLSKALDRLGDTTILRDDEEDDIGAAFQKFAVVTKELGALMKNMVRFPCLVIPCGAAGS